MTATETETGPGTAVEQVAGGALAIVKDGEPWTLAKLAGILAGPVPETDAAVPAPAPAPRAQVTGKLKAALSKLPRVFAKVMPDEPRKLTDAELADLTDEYVTLENLTEGVIARQEAIAVTVAHHMDAVALERGLATVKDRIPGGKNKGHLLAATKGDPFKIEVPGFADPWKQVRTAAAPKVVGARIAGLFKDAKISRAEYLSCTRAVRVFDEISMAAFIRANPERGLEILKAITETGTASASLYRPQK